MTRKTTNRRGRTQRTTAFVRSLDPLRDDTVPADSRSVAGAPASGTGTDAYATLLTLAREHPRNAEASTGRTRRSRRHRRAGWICAAVLALSGTGGVAYAAINDWEPVKAAWLALTGGEPGFDVDTPVQVGAGRALDGTELLLWQARNNANGECISLRTPASSTGVDGCGGGGGDVVEQTTNVQAVEATTILHVPDSFVLYGRQAPGVSVVVLDQPGLPQQTFTVNPDTGYWVGQPDLSSIEGSTLRAVDRDGATLGERDLDDWLGDLPPPPLTRTEKGPHEPSGANCRAA